MFYAILFGGFGFISGLVLSEMYPGIAKKVLDKIKAFMEEMWRYAGTGIPRW